MGSDFVQCEKSLTVGRGLIGAKGAYPWELSFRLLGEKGASRWNGSSPVVRELLGGNRAFQWEESYPVVRELPSGKRAS